MVSNGLRCHTLKISRNKKESSQGNFTDNLGNQIEKHIMGYNWVHHQCSTPRLEFVFLWTMCRDLNQTLLYMILFRFVLKTDDDVFVEIFHLFNFVSAVYGFSPGPSLVRPSITTTSSNSICTVDN